MIKLGKLTDYAIVVMVEMSKNANESALSAHTLAERIGLPEPTVAKVLKKLCNARLVESTRGTHGGYKALKSANQITVADVVTAIDGPIVITSCVAHSGDTCMAETRCPVRGGWNRINDAIRDALAAVTIADMGASLTQTHNFVKVNMNVAHV